MALEALYDALVDNKLCVSFFNTVGLPRLAPHWPRVFTALAFFQFVYVISDVISPLVFQKTWRRLTKVEKYKWNVRKASSCHAVYIITKALVIIANSRLRNDPVHGTDPVAEHAYAVTVGYFLWDMINTYSNIDINGWGFMVHAVMSFGVYLLSYTPFLQYYGACFMMFEISTLFLNLHNSLEDTNCKDAVMYFINAMALVSSFFFARIVYGTMLSINVWRGIANSAIPINPLVTNFVRIANLTLLGLSYYWFCVIIATAKSTVLDADLIHAIDDMDKKDE
ncbi:hypothetical protein GGI12_003023 [Dipsacomyces acuminosporus]|nr:hypothetical protein GGI12_003023 [Dipsacomyces acuminosporus]